MYLRHEFILLSTELAEKDINENLCNQLANKKPVSSCSVVDCFEVEDAVFDFIWFSFQWIPSTNPSFYNDSKHTMGIYRHAFTLFSRKSQVALITNCKCWLQLVEFAPDIIKLHDNYIDYLEKNELISFFKNVLQFSENLDQKGIYILHSGI